MNSRIIILFSLIIAIGCAGKKSSEKEAETTTENRKPKVHVEQVWATDTLLRTPESTLYDKERQVIYVSNINGDAREKDANGFISRLKPDGEILDLKWIDGLNAPKGMGIFKNLLYVADINEIVVINISEGVVVEKYEAPDAGMFNDITISAEGIVYTTDSDKNKILVLRSAEFSEWIGGDLLDRPNGLFWEAGQIMLASSGHEQFRKIDPETKEITIVADGIGHGDGIARDLKGNYLVSNWQGQVFYIDGDDGHKTELIDTRDQNINAADIDLVTDDDLLLVPTFNNNRVVAYRLIYE